MLLPHLIEDLQEQALLHRAHDLGAEVGGLFRHFAVAGIGQALADLGVGDAFLGGPRLDGHVDAEQAQRLFVQRPDVPLFGVGLLGDAARHQFVDHLVAHVDDGGGDVLDLHELAALLVDDLALVVHHVVELEEVLADFEVARLDLLLGLLQGLVDPRMDDGLAVLEAELPQHAVDALGAEDAHEVVFQGQEELRRAGVALAPRAAPELVVDATALVALGADDEEAARRDHRLLVFRHLGADLGGAARDLVSVLDVGHLLLDEHFHVAAELDVGAPPRHVGGDGDAPRLSGLGDDVGLLLVVAGVEHVVGDFLLLEQLGKVLRLLDADGADQGRLAALLAFGDEVGDGLVFLGAGAVDLVVHVFADAGQVGRNLDHLEIVDFGQLAGLGHGGAGHAGELGIEPEVVLEGDRGQGLVFLLDLHPFLGLERLVQALGIAPTLHHATGELVDDDDLVVLDDVVGIAREQFVGAQPLGRVVDQRDVGDVVEAAFVEQAGVAHQRLDVLGAGLGEGDGAHLLVLLVVFLHEKGDELVDGGIEGRGGLGGARDDQRRARLVDEDGIDLVDDGVGKGPLHHVLEAELHVVAQIIEAELVVGAVGDVGAIGGAPLVVIEPVHDAAHREPQEAVYPAHPFGVALGQVIVDGDHVHAAAAERVEVYRQGRHQGLALARLHLRDHAPVQHDAAQELHVERTLAEPAPGRLAHRGEGIHQQVVHLLAVLQAGA